MFQVHPIHIGKSFTGHEAPRKLGSFLACLKIVNRSGCLDIATYNFPVASYIKVYDSGRKEIASTTSLVMLMGGDISTGKATLKQAVAGILSESTLVYFVVPVAT